MKREGIQVEERASGAAAPVALGDGGPQTRIMLFPIGQVKPKDGREPWTLRDVAHAQDVIDATRAHLGSLDLMVDYDHQAVTAPKLAGQAKAAGWIDPTTLEAANDGIYGTVEWTAAARAALEAREYRYISPHFGFTKDSQRAVTRLFNAALVNIPALEMAAVAAQQPGEDNMKDIALALGLSAEADEATIVTAINDLKNSTSLTAIAGALGIAEDSSAEDIATAAAAAAEVKPVDLTPIAKALGLEGEQTVEQLATAAASAGEVDATKFVPIETHRALQAKVAEGDEGKATAAVDAAIASGKIAPANRDFYLGTARKDLAGFETFVANAPVVLKPGENTDTAGKKPVDATLTDEERAACHALNITEEQYLETKKDEA